MHPHVILLHGVHEIVCFLSDRIFLFAWSSDKLDVETLYLVAFYALSAQVRFDQSYQFVVNYIPEDMIVLVVEMDVLECIYIKIHLVVGTETVVIYT